MKRKFIIGIDEVGRGPLAGPVMVGVVCVPANFDWSLLPGVGDSKQVTPKNRAAIFRQAQALKKAGQLLYIVASVEAKEIDKVGITVCIKNALRRGLKKINQAKTRSESDLILFGTVTNWQQVTVKLDGGLRAPDYCVNQETIIKGDSKEKVIGLASIVAKVTRDCHMEQLGQKASFTSYDFAAHKGYGTKRHQALIREHGLSLEHRTSFCRRLV